MNNPFFSESLASYVETVEQVLDKPFALTGRQAYLIGFMNGSFPDLGQHLPGEMGGLWTPPLKLADGWWFGLSQFAQDWQWLAGASCTRFEMQPGQVKREFSLEIGGNSVQVTQTLFVPETESAIFISLSLTNPTNQAQSLQLAWLVRFELRGAWWTDWPDRADIASYDAVSGSILACDSLTTDWAAMMQGDKLPVDFQIGANLWANERTGSLKGSDNLPEGILRNPAELQGEGISGQLVYKVELGPKASQTLNFVITGRPDCRDKAVLRQHSNQLLQKREYYLLEKMNRLEKWLEGAPKLAAPLPGYDHIFASSMLCLDLLTLNLSQVGQGLIAGLPEFAWFFGCDTYYSLSGLLVSGLRDTALANLRLLAGYARKQNGRIPHEIVQNGEMFNPGNSIETAEYLISVERAFRWTGDRAFLNEIYPVCKSGLFDYLLGECDPQGDLLPGGAGLLELSSAKHGKKLDVASCLYQALGSIAYLAKAMNDFATVARVQGLAEQVQKKIEDYFWMAERGEYLWRIEDDLTALPDEPGHSYAVLEMGVVQDATKARRLFEKVEGPEHTGPKGLIHPGTTDFVMPIQNAIMALAEFRYHRPDQGLRYLQFCAEVYGYYMPWAIPEFVGPNACFLQAWSSAAFNWLIVQGFFRLQPDPLTATILVQPQLPTGWRQLQISNIEVWGALYDLRLERQPDDQIKFSYTAHNLLGQPARFEVSYSTEVPANFI